MTDKKLITILSVVIASSYMYFFQGGGYNQNTRIDMVYSVLQNHALQIDAVHDNTEDKAFVAGHYYCDKAPGLQIFTLPAAWLFTKAAALAGIPLSSGEGFTWLMYVATVFGAGAVSVVTAILVFRLVRRLGGGQQSAAMAMIALALGSPMWAYATLFWGHALVAGLLVTAMWIALHIRHAPNQPSVLGWWFGFGLCTGGALLTSYPSVVPAGILAGWLILETARRTSWRHMSRCAGAFTLAALICLIALAAHNQVVGGSPISLSYTHTQGFDGMKSGFFGVGWPKLHVIKEIFFGSTRGLFLLAPSLLVGLSGLVQLARQRGDAGFVGKFGLIVLAFFCLLNAGYYYWDGGYTYGPRHMGDGLPWFAIGLGYAASRATARFRTLTWGLVAVGVALALMAVSVGTPDGETLVPIQAFLAGDVPSAAGSVVPRALRFDSATSHAITHSIWNIGTLLGMRGHASLVPLLAIWAFALGYIAYLRRKNLFLSSRYETVT